MKVTGLYCYNCEKFIYSRSRHDMVACDCYSINKELSVSIDGGQSDYVKVSTNSKSNYKFLQVEMKGITEEDLINDWRYGNNNYGFVYNLSINKAILEDIGGITKNKLEHLSYYIGICRNSSVAQWNEKENKFLYMRNKMGNYFVDKINHPEDDDGYDLFIPLKKVNSPYSLLPKELNNKRASELFPKKNNDN